VDDYPRTIEEFERRFSSKQACRRYLEALRWPDGFRCPACQGEAAALVRDGLYQCRRCRRQTSATAGTIFQDTRKPLVMWFRAMWYVTSQKNGASALGLQRVLGLGSYETAWTWLHKLRRAMIRPDRDRLSGWIEVDETFIGGLAEGAVGGRQKANKALVVIAAQADGPAIGRIRMRMVADASAESLHSFVIDCIEPGSRLHTDGWLGYTGLEKKGFEREVSTTRGRRKDASKLLPRAHRVASLLKRWLLGTHQGAVAPWQLPYYLDEFTFRFNRRTSKSRGKLFFRLMQQAVNTPPATYEAMINMSPLPQDIGAR
jgi:ISXO2-like transposase domain/Transposase zinc-ribbon domain